MTQRVTELLNAVEIMTSRMGEAPKTFPEECNSASDFKGSGKTTLLYFVDERHHRPDLSVQDSS
jgi:hypothetical protein